ncbi:hypothetical protein GGU10DRAFT_337966, partial [Lentinula aff. detonsa]
MEQIESLPSITPRHFTPNKPFDYSKDAQYDGRLLHHADIPRPRALSRGKVEVRARKARDRAQRMLGFFDDEVLEFQSPHAFSYFAARRLEYLGARNSRSYQDFIAGIKAERLKRFSNTSPNPFSIRIFTDDNQKILSAFQYRAPDDMIGSNHLLVAEGRRPDVMEQPGRSALRGKGKHHLIPENLRLQYLHAAQGLLSVLPPEKVESSRRHGAVDGSYQTSHYFTHRGWDGKQDLTPERKGTLHIVPCWTQQGHPLHTMTPSAAFTANGCATAALENFYSQ